MRKFKDFESFDWLAFGLFVFAVSSIVMVLLRAGGVIAISYWVACIPIILVAAFVVVFVVAYADGMSR